MPHSLADRRGAASATAGFTLVEVLVAMVVMALMAVMAWQGVDGITRSRGVSQARLEYTLRLDNPGTFQLPATRVEAMYAPETYAERPNAPLTIEAP